MKRKIIWSDSVPQNGAAEQLFCLRESRSGNVWNGVEWVTPMEEAARFTSIDRALTAVRRYGLAAAELLVVFPRTARQMVIPLQPQFADCPRLDEFESWG